jgi:hypothetical protein
VDECEASLRDRSTQEQLYDDSSSSLPAEAQRLLENTLVKPNHAQTQMPAEIAHDRLVISKLQVQLEQIENSRTQGINEGKAKLPFQAPRRILQWSTRRNKTLQEHHSKNENTMPSQPLAAAGTRHPAKKTVAVNNAISSSTAEITPSKKVHIVKGGRRRISMMMRRHLGLYKRGQKVKKAAAISSRRHPNRRITRTLPILRTFPLTIARVVECYPP